MPVFSLKFIALIGFLLAPTVAVSAPTAIIGTHIGHAFTVEIADGETLHDLARRYNLGFVELRAANPDVEIWIPEPGKPVLIPNSHIAPPAGGAQIVVNRAELRLYVFKAGAAAWSAPISVGRDGHGTPLGDLPVGQKRKDPIWYPTESHREADPELPAAIPAGPGNPLGTHALRLGWTEYLIHGTNKPYSIGRRVSRGCIRVGPQDIARIYEEVEVGGRVRIVDSAIKLAMHGGQLYLEVAPSQLQVDALDRGYPRPSDPVIDIETAIHAVAADYAEHIDWARVAKTANERRGVPIAITPPLIESSLTDALISASSG